MVKKTERGLAVYGASDDLLNMSSMTLDTAGRS